MKKILLLLFLFAGLCAGAQTQGQIDTLEFCNHKYKTPEGCRVKRRTEVMCDHYKVEWTYLDTAILKEAVIQYLANIVDCRAKARKDEINASLLDTKVQCYKASFQKDSVTHWQIIAYGLVEQRGVFLELNLDKEPNTNADIPVFVRQFLKLNN